MATRPLIDTMHRRPLIDALQHYRDAHPDERIVADRILALVNKHADCFDRTCRPGHVTGSAWVLSTDRRRVLLLHHRKLDRWLQPGGHADGDPDTQTVALREAQEESGLEHLETIDPSGVGVPFDLDVHLIPARFADDGGVLEDAHEHHDVRYLFAATGSETLAVSNESHAVRWVTPAELQELTREESVLRMLRKAAPHMSDR